MRVTAKWRQRRGRYMAQKAVEGTGRSVTRSTSIQAKNMTAFSPLLSSASVSKETTLSERSIQRGVQAGTFPSPVSISVLAGGSGRVAWRASDVQAWIDSRPSIKTSIKGEVSA